MKLIINRHPSGINSTLGFLQLECDTSFFLYIMELPWKNNEQRVSCIPCGLYDLEYRVSEKYGEHILVKDVPGRSYILFHWGNYPKNYKGCIGSGLSQSEDYIGNTKKAHKKLMNRILPELKAGKCKLEIKNHV